MPSLKDTCLEFSKNYPTCAHAVSLLVDIYEEEASKESLGQAIEVKCSPPFGRPIPEHLNKEL